MPWKSIFSEVSNFNRQNVCTKSTCKKNVTADNAGYEYGGRALYRTRLRKYNAEAGASCKFRSDRLYDQLAVDRLCCTYAEVAYGFNLRARTFDTNFTMKKNIGKSSYAESWTRNSRTEILKLRRRAAI